MLKLKEEEPVCPANRLPEFMQSADTLIREDMEDLYQYLKQHIIVGNSIIFCGKSLTKKSALIDSLIASIRSTHKERNGDDEFYTSPLVLTDRDSTYAKVVLERISKENPFLLEMYATSHCDAIRNLVYIMLDIYDDVYPDEANTFTLEKVTNKLAVCTPLVVFIDNLVDTRTVFRFIGYEKSTDSFGFEKINF